MSATAVHVFVGEWVPCTGSLRPGCTWHLNGSMLSEGIFLPNTWELESVCFFKDYYYILFILCVYKGCRCMPQYACWGQRATCMSILSTIWVLGIKLWSLDLEGGSSTCLALSRALTSFPERKGGRFTQIVQTCDYWLGGEIFLSVQCWVRVPVYRKWRRNQNDGWPCTGSWLCLSTDSIIGDYLGICREHMTWMKCSGGFLSNIYFILFL